MEPMNVSLDMIINESYHNLTQDESQDLTRDESQDLTGDESKNVTQDKPSTIKSKLSKTDVEKLIAQNSDRISYNVKGGKAKADAWTRFRIISVDGNLSNFVSCNTCRAIYTCKPRSGTRSLNRHICQSPTINRKRGTGKPLTVKTSESVEHYLVKKVPEHAKHDLNKSITFGLGKDLKSLRSVEGPGFKHMAQVLIDFGAKYGNQRVEDIIQHRTTLRNVYVPELCNDARQKYKMMFQSMPVDHKYAFSKDLWSEKYRKRNFLSLSCHVIDNEWKLHAVMLGLDEMFEDKTVGYLRKRCSEILKSYFDESRVERIIQTSYSVTDGGSNMLTIFENHLPCECHKLNLFVSWTLNQKKLPTDEKIAERLAKGNPFNPKKLFNLQTHCPGIFAILTGVKNVVKYFKQSSLNATLSTTLKQYVETRWDSELEMYDKVKDEVQVLLLKHHQLAKIQNIDQELLHQLIKFLQPIRKCSQTLSGDKYPTIQLVAVCFSELYEEIRKLVEEHQEQFEDDFLQRDTATPTSSHAPANTKSSRFERFQDVESDAELNELPEVDRYMSLKLA